MAKLTVTIGVGNQQGEKLEDLDVIVDTGSTFTAVPRTVLKMVDSSRNDLSQPFLTQPKLCRRRPNSTRRRLAPGFPPGCTDRLTAKTNLIPRTSPDRRRLAIPFASPVQLCKSASQLTRYGSPQRPYVLHALPCRYAEGNMSAETVGTYPPVRNALGTAE